MLKKWHAKRFRFLWFRAWGIGFGLRDIPSKMENQMEKRERELESGEL